MRRVSQGEVLFELRSLRIRVSGNESSVLCVEGECGSQGGRKCKGPGGMRWGQQPTVILQSWVRNKCVSRSRSGAK